MTPPGQQLAFAVIQLCYNDFKTSPLYVQSDMDFLTGASDIGLYWFDVAGIQPFTSKQIWLGVL